MVSIVSVPPRPLGSSAVCMAGPTSVCSFWQQVPAAQWDRRVGCLPSTAFLSNTAVLRARGGSRAGVKGTSQGTSSLALQRAQGEERTERGTLALDRLNWEGRDRPQCVWSAPSLKGRVSPKAPQQGGHCCRLTLGVEQGKGQLAVRGMVLRWVQVLFSAWRTRQVTGRG